jgi:hypothetical protein
LELINNSPERARKSAKLEASLEKLKGELKKYRQLKAELYPDFKAGLIELSEYEMFRTKYDISIADIEERINQTQEKIVEIEQGISPENSFIKAFRDSDCLVHVEAFDKESVDLVKGSVSTKIADSLASGIPLLAYGPAGVASMEHLRRNDCAFLAGDYESLKMVIRELLTDREKRKLVSENALYTARCYHVSDTNSMRLRSIIQQITGET